MNWPSEVQGSLRIDAGVRAPGRVTPFYDPMIAKLIAHAPTRAEAIAKLVEALAQVEIAPLVTNLAFLKAVLVSEEFAAGAYDTTFAEAFAKRK